MQYNYDYKNATDYDNDDDDDDDNEDDTCRRCSGSTLYNCGRGTTPSTEEMRASPWQPFHSSDVSKICPLVLREVAVPPLITPVCSVSSLISLFMYTCFFFPFLVVVLAYFYFSELQHIALFSRFLLCVMRGKQARRRGH